MFKYKNVWFTRVTVVLYRYRNETNGASTAEMEDGVASTEQSTL